jgi:hypothetical protein
MTAAIEELKDALLNKNIREKNLKQSEMAELKNMIEKLHLDVKLIKEDTAAFKRAVSIPYIHLTAF